MIHFLVCGLVFYVTEIFLCSVYDHNLFHSIVLLQIIKSSLQWFFFLQKKLRIIKKDYNLFHSIVLFQIIESSLQRFFFLQKKLRVIKKNQNMFRSFNERMPFFNSWLLQIFWFTYQYNCIPISKFRIGCFYLVTLMETCVCLWEHQLAKLILYLFQFRTCNSDIVFCIMFFLVSLTPYNLCSPTVSFHGLIYLFKLFLLCINSFSFFFFNLTGIKYISLHETVEVLAFNAGIVERDGLIGLYWGFVLNALKNLPNSRSFQHSFPIVSHF